MIRITIEIIPFGDEHKKRKIQEILIANVSNESKLSSDYIGIISKDNWTKENQKEFFIKNHDRSKGILCLLKKILNQKESPLPKKYKETLDYLKSIIWNSQ